MVITFTQPLFAGWKMRFKDGVVKDSRTSSFFDVMLKKDLQFLMLFYTELDAQGQHKRQCIAGSDFFFIDIIAEVFGSQFGGTKQQILDEFSNAMIISGPKTSDGEFAIITGIAMNDYDID